MQGCDPPRQPMWTRCRGVEFLANFHLTMLGRWNAGPHTWRRGSRRISIGFAASSPRRGIVFDNLRLWAEEVAGDDDGWLLNYKSGSGWCVFWSTILPQWHLEQPPVHAEHECRRHTSVYGGFWKVLRPSIVAVCAVRTWNSVHYFLLASYFAVLCPVFGCCSWSTGN